MRTSTTSKTVWNTLKGLPEDQRYLVREYSDAMNALLNLSVDEFEELRSQDFSVCGKFSVTVPLTDAILVCLVSETAIESVRILPFSL